MDEIHGVTGIKLAELRDVMAERKHWRRMVKTVARTRRVDSTRCVCVYYLYSITAIKIHGVLGVVKSDVSSNIFYEMVSRM